MCESIRTIIPKTLSCEKCMPFLELNCPNIWRIELTYLTQTQYTNQRNGNYRTGALLDACAYIPTGSTYVLNNGVHLIRNQFLYCIYSYMYA